MSFIGKNIRKIRSIKGINQSQFAELFGITRASIGAYEEGRAEPKISTIMEIANHFSISIDLLLRKELTVNELSRFDIVEGEQGSNRNAYESAGPMQIPIIVPNAFEQYSNSSTDSEFLETLPGIQSHSMVIRGERLFEVDTMALANETGDIREGDLLICSRIPDSRLDRIEEGQVHVVVLKKQILIRRLRRKGKSLELYTNHPDFEPISVAPSKVKELWKANGVISYQLNIPTASEDRLTQLEKTVADLIKQVNKLSK